MRETVPASNRRRVATITAVMGLAVGSNAIERLRAPTAARLLDTSASVRWVSIGPAPLAYESAGSDVASFNSGRIAAIDVDPRDPHHWLVGTGNGGVWETHDASTWTPVTDAAPTLASGSLAFAPSNPGLIFVGTGEAVGASFAKTGVGILKSSDSGKNWTLVGRSTFERSSIRRIRVHPENPDVLLAISSRAGFGRDSQEGVPASPPFGVHKSTDGGATWTRKLTGLATALEIDTRNFSRQYAAIGNQRVGVNILNDSANGVANGVYRSTDAGETWTVIDGPWGRSDSATRSTVGRIELAMAPSNPNVIYAGIQIPPNGGGNNTGLLGLYRTDNAFADQPTWIKIPTEQTGAGGYCGPEKCGYSHLLSVDPGDANRLFAGGAEQGFWRCANCAASPSWLNVAPNATRLHSDYHAAAWAGNELIIGNDGGIWSTSDFGASWHDHNAGLPTLLFFSGALHPSDSNFILAGLRDFRPAVRRGTDWRILDGRDLQSGEAEVAISSSHPDTDWMMAAIWGVIRRTMDGGKSDIAADNGIDKTGVGFVAPVKKCPFSDNVFLTGTNRMWRTEDFFNSVSPVWSANGPPHAYQFPNAYAAPGTILSIVFAPTDTRCRTYAYGNRGGQIFRTDDAGATWIDLDPRRTLPARPVNSMAFESGNANVLYAAFSSFEVATPNHPGHVFKTTNALANEPSWIDVSPDADVPFNVIAIDPRSQSRLYAGSDLGLWRSDDGGGSWAKDGLETGLPNVTVYDIQVNAATNRTVVFTYGRGAYVLSESQQSLGRAAEHRR